MPRQFGKVDASASWEPCVNCRLCHLAGSACPPIGVWLVLALCSACDERQGVYCYTHRGRT